MLRAAANAAAARLSTAAAAEAMNTGRRYAASEALAVGIVDEVASETEVLATAVAGSGSGSPSKRQ